MASDHSTGNPRPVKIPTVKWLTIGKLYYYYTPPPKTPRPARPTARLPSPGSR